jgi:hypothetical protein
LREAKQRLEAEREAQREADRRPGGEDPELRLELDRERLVSCEQGRRGWMRDARRQIDERRRPAARGTGRRDQHDRS